MDINILIHSGPFAAAADLPEPRNQSQVEVEDILQPLDGSSRLVGQDLDQIGASLVPRRLEGIFVELLDAILDPEIGLCSGEGAVDTGCGLGRVATEEICTTSDHLSLDASLSRGSSLTLLVQNKDVSAVQVDSMGRTQARHCEAKAVSAGTDVARGGVGEGRREKNPRERVHPPPTKMTLGAMFAMYN